MTTKAFEELKRTMVDLEKMVEGGEALGKLGVDSFDIGNIYRQAWVGAVSALDHWVGEEIRERAVKLFARPGEKPDKLKRVQITVGRFERVHHKRESAEEVFREQLEETLGFTSYQSPNKIKDGLALVTDASLWQDVSKRVSETRGERVSASAITDQLQKIAQRRNKIAHETDRDPSAPDGKRSITAEETRTTIELLSEITAAILHVLDQDSGQGTGNGHLLVLSGGESVRWVLGSSRMAFNPVIRKKAESLLVGDTLYIVTTKECWGRSSDARTLVVGTATVRTPVRELDEEERHHEGSKYRLGCDLELRSLAPFRQGVELGGLVPALVSFKEKKNWGLHLQQALFTLKAEDVETVQTALSRVVGDPADYAGDYVSWQRPTR